MSISSISTAVLLLVSAALAVALVAGACGASEAGSASGTAQARTSRIRAGKDGLLVGGIQVNEPSLGRWVEALDEAGLDTVAVTDYAKQGDWDSANLWWDE